MRSRSVPRLRAAGLSAALAATALAALPSSAAAAPAPPNIILVVADDLGYDQTTLYDRPGAIPTPNIDALGDAGVRAGQGYVAAPVCSPSRSAMMTGREPARAGADSNFLTRARPERMPADTFVKDLPAPYTTAAIGKWDLAGNPPYNSRHLPAAMGFDDFYGFLGGMHSYCPPTNGKPNLKQYDPASQTYKDRTSTSYLTDEFTDRSVDYINRHAQGSTTDPFFMYVAYNAPHTPLESPTSCSGGAQSDQDRFSEMVRTMDSGVGRIRKAVADNGIADNTMVVFVSDNGQQTDYFTGPTRGGKYTLFEGGVKVPFAMTWPAALPAGTTYPDPVSTLDLRPTFLKAARSSAPPPTGTSGVDLLPYLSGQRTGRPHTDLSWRYVVDKPEAGQQGATIVAQRSGDKKWISETTPQTGTAAGPTTRNHLFDLASSPSEADSANLWPNASLSGPLFAAHHAWNRANPTAESFKNPRSADDVRGGRPDGYIEAGGTWKVVDSGADDKSYQGTSTGFAGRSMLEPSFYDNADVSTDVKLTTPGQAGLIVRGSGAGQTFDGYLAALRIPPQGTTQLVLSKVHDGTATPVATRNIALTTGTAYHLTVHAVGSTLSVGLGGQEQLTWNDTSNTAYGGGSVGFKVSGTEAGRNATARFATLGATNCTGSCAG